MQFDIEIARYLQERGSQVSDILGANFFAIFKKNVRLIYKSTAQMAKLVDVLRLERSAARRAGSNPVLGTWLTPEIVSPALLFLYVCQVSSYGLIGSSLSAQRFVFLGWI